MYGFSAYSEAPYATLPTPAGDLSAVVNATLANATLNSAATVGLAATLSKTLASATLVSTATLDNTASLAKTLASATLSATATLQLQASLSATLQGASLVSEASITDPILAATTAQFADATLVAVIVGGYYPVLNQRTLNQITNAQSTLPSHITKQISSATQITA